MCCFKGKIKLPKIDNLPSEFLNLFTGQDDISKKFHDHIHNYNNALAMTSQRGKQDTKINNGGGPYVYRVYSRMHQKGSVIPRQESTSVFAQPYIYDPRVHRGTMQTL